MGDDGSPRIVVDESLNFGNGFESDMRVRAHKRIVSYYILAIAFSL